LVDSANVVNLARNSVGVFDAASSRDISSDM
jgi:hypothetical protein